MLFDASVREREALPNAGVDEPVLRVQHGGPEHGNAEHDDTHDGNAERNHAQHAIQRSLGVALSDPDRAAIQHTLGVVLSDPDRAAVQRTLGVALSDPDRAAVQRTLGLNGVTVLTVARSDGATVAAPDSGPHHCGDDRDHHYA